MLRRLRENRAIRRDVKRQLRLLDRVFAVVFAPRDDPRA